MSLVGTREAIAIALSTVTDVRGFAYRASTPMPGDAWPLLGELERADGLSFSVNWKVMVFLPQGELAASDWIDSHYDAIVDALEPIGYVERLSPVVVSTSAGNQYFLEITMRGD